MSLERDLISEDSQLSPTTMSEKYTNEEHEEHSVISTIPEGDDCDCFHENGHEYVRLSETDSSVVQIWTDCDHHHQEHHDCCDHHDHECPQHHQHRYHIPHWSTITMSDDDIEIITDPEYYRQFDDVFYIDRSVARSLLSEFLIHEQEPPKLRIHVDTRTKRQRFIARAVMIISMVMFTVSVLLVIISLIMSDHIDHLVRNSNNLLLKPSSSPVGSSTSLTLILVNGTVNNSTEFG